MNGISVADIVPLVAASIGLLASLSTFFLKPDWKNDSDEHPKSGNDSKKPE